MAGVMVVDTHYGYMSAVFRGGAGEKVDLESSKYDLKPQIGQFGYLEPLIFFFSTFLLWGGGMVEKVDLETYRCDFYFSTFIRGVKW